MDLRPATLADADLLYDWRVEGETADWYTGPKTTRMEHWQWLHPRLRKNSLCRIWVAEVDGTPVGVVRLDSNDELSVEIAPQHRGNGYGVEAVNRAIGKTKGRVKASVDGQNDAARRTFVKAGFQPRPDVHFYLYTP